MTQIVYVSQISSEAVQYLELPDPSEFVMPGVPWGKVDEVFTPAYWAAQLWFVNSMVCSITEFRLGTSLQEEIAACILGGYGIPAEIGLAAYYRLRDSGLLSADVPDCKAIHQALVCPLLIDGREVHYRFAKQRSEYLSQALEQIAGIQFSEMTDLEFRAWLMRLRGIGPKTASWITRNWLGSDEVAIIDVHVHRAGVLAGIFEFDSSPNGNYFAMERRYLDFARAISSRPSVLDAVIWSQMREAKDLAIHLYNNSVRQSRYSIPQ